MSQELQEHIDELVEKLEWVVGHAISHDTPYADSGAIAINLLKLIPELFAKIKHGEPGHEEWLREAIHNHFLGLPMPEYVAK